MNLHERFVAEVVKAGSRHGLEVRKAFRNEDFGTVSFARRGEDEAEFKVTAYRAPDKWTFVVNGPFVRRSREMAEPGTEHKVGRFRGTYDDVTLLNEMLTAVRTEADVVAGYRPRDLSLGDVLTERDRLANAIKGMVEKSGNSAADVVAEEIARYDGLGEAVAERLTAPTDSILP